MSRGTFVFVAGPPKSAVSVPSVNELKKRLSKTNRIESAKDVGNFTYKVFMSGPQNYYIKGSRALIDLLNKHGALR